ncbi:MAG: hypothetical protein NUV76_00345 [Candidatus Kuenenia sp.]|nr:hypothetical protein [Candidatus Kuenenia sp.]
MWKRTFKCGDSRVLKYIDSNTGLTVKEVALSESEYNTETIRLSAADTMRKNPGMSYREAFLAVSESEPELFGRKTKTNDLAHSVMDNFDKLRKEMVSEFMGKNEGASYRDAILAVSEERPDLFQFNRR